MHKQNVFFKQKYDLFSKVRFRREILCKNLQNFNIKVNIILSSANFYSAKFNNRAKKSTQFDF